MEANSRMKPFLESDLERNSRMTLTNKLSNISPLHKDKFFKNSKDGKKYIVRVVVIGTPRVIEQISPCTDAGDFERKVQDARYVGTDAYCVGAPVIRAGDNSKQTLVYTPVQYYKIQKPWWQKVEAVLNAFWDKAANPYVGGELR